MKMTRDPGTGSAFPGQGTVPSTPFSVTVVGTRQLLEGGGVLPVAGTSGVRPRTAREVGNCLAGARRFEEVRWQQRHQQ
jgi:hypothetical protein